VAVAQECGSFLDGPTWTLDPAGYGDSGVAGGVVSEPALTDGVVERAGQCGDTPPDGDRAAAGGELGAHEVVDVLVGEPFEPDRAEGRQQVVVQVVAVAGHGGRLEPACLGLQPAD